MKDRKLIKVSTTELSMWDLEGSFDKAIAQLQEWKEEYSEGLPDGDYVELDVDYSYDSRELIVTHWHPETDEEYSARKSNERYELDRIVEKEVQKLKELMKKYPNVKGD